MAMDTDNLHRLTDLACEDLARSDLRRAKDRLRTVLRDYPTDARALDLMGRIYNAHGDFRNAAMYWARAGRWDESTSQACERIFKSLGRALARENGRAARYYLYAFAGVYPPPAIADELDAYRSAYFKLQEKQSMVRRMACAPGAGLLVMSMFGIIVGLLGGGWESLAMIGALALTATLIVLGLIVGKYIRTLRLYDKTIEELTQGESES